MGKLHLHIHASKKRQSTADTSIHIHICEDGAKVWNGAEPSGGRGSGQMELSALPAGQRIRPKFYKLKLVPEVKPTRSQRSRKPDQYKQFREEDIKLELASGNQRDPVTWESFAPAAASGQWRFTVRRDFDRMMGVLTFARNPSAMWVVSEWTPKGSLVLDPVRPGVDPKMLLNPMAP